MSERPNLGYRFPWREGNSTQLLVDAEQFYPAMLQAIYDARRYVLLEMYLVESGAVADRFIEAFCDAAHRGVNVYLLLDGYGSLGLNKRDQAQLKQADIQLVFYNPLHYGKLRRNFFRDHRKLLLVDGELAVIGGVGITDQFDPPNDPAKAWRDTAIVLRGPCVADWEAVFTRTWDKWATLSLPAGDQSRAVRQAGQAVGRLTCTWGRGFQEIKRSLIKRIRNAERVAWVATAYFVPSRKIRRALKRAARRGVDVRLLLPGGHTDHPAVRHAGRRFYFSLLLAGVRIFEYQPRFSHTKLLLCDGWVSIGSSNLDRWNLRWNLEANQEIEDYTLVENVTSMFEQDFSNSHEWLLSDWRQRSWSQRIQEWFWGKVDVWLDRWIDSHRFPSRSEHNKEH